MRKAEGTRQKAEVRNMLRPLTGCKKGGPRQRVPHLCFVPRLLVLLMICSSRLRVEPTDCYRPLEILHGLDLTVERGEMLAIIVGAWEEHALACSAARDVGISGADAAMESLNDEARVAFRNRSSASPSSFTTCCPEFT